MSKRILVADDNELMRHQIRMIVEPDPEIEFCAEAANGFEAVQKTEECHPDLGVIDFQMPVMNGLDATREIKTLASSVPVLIFALEKSAQLESAATEAGADAFLAKTEGTKRLAQVIHTLLRPSSNPSMDRNLPFNESAAQHCRPRKATPRDR